MDALQTPPHLRKSRALALGFAALLAAIGATSALTFQAASRCLRDSDSASAAHDALAAVIAVQALLHEAESGQRGYILTGNPAFLEPYRAAHSRIWPALGELDGLIRDNPTQLHLMRVLRETTADKFRGLVHSIEMRQNGDEPAARKMVESGVGKQQMDDIRRIVAEMREEERSALARKQMEAEATRIHVDAMIGTLSALNAGMLGLCFVTVRRARRREQRFAARFTGKRLRRSLVSGDGKTVGDHPILDGGRTAEPKAVKKLERLSRQMRLHPAAAEIIEPSRHPLPDLAGEINGHFTFGRPVTPLRDCAGVRISAFESHDLRGAPPVGELAQRQLAAILESSEDAIIGKTLDGIVTSWNDAAERLFGYSAGEIVGRPLLLLIPPECLEEESQVLTRLRRGEHIERYETQRIRRDGTSIPVSLTVSPTLDENGAVISAFHVIRDISGRKQAEAALQATLSRMQATFENAAVGIADVALDGRFLRVNERLCAIVGYRRDELSGMSFEEITHPDDLAADWEQAHRLLAGEIPSYSMEKRYIHRSGHLIWIDLTAGLARRPDGTPDYFVSVIEDITTRKQAEEQLRVSESRLRYFLDYVPAELAMFDREMRYLFVSRRWREDYRLGDIDLTGRRHYDFFPDLPDSWRDAHRRGLAGEVLRADADRFERADGSVQWLRWEVRPWFEASGDQGGILIFAEDVSERIEAQREVNASKRRLGGIVESAMDAIITVDEEQRIVLFNGAAETMFRLPESAALGSSLERLIPSRFRAAHSSHVREFGASGTTARSMGQLGAISGVRSDGEEFPIEASISKVDVDGRRLLTVILRDITERRRAEEATRESEARFRTLADHMAQLAWMADDAGSVFWYNRRWFDYTGTTLEEMQGRGWKKVHHPEHLDRVIARFENSIETGEDWEDTFPLRGKDGQYHWFLSRAMPIRDNSGKVVRWFGTNTDVTDQRRAEEALRNADRRKDEFLAMLGHELRNPLAPVRNAVSLMKRAGSTEPLVERARDMIDRQVTHMARLVDDLLDATRIARGKVLLKKECCDLTAIVREGAEDYRSILEAGGLNLTVEVPSTSIWVTGDPTRLTQMLGNLLHNAHKFTDRGGKVAVRLTVEPDTAAPGFTAQAVIAVRDSGIGIDPEMLCRVFDVFAQADRSLDRSRGGLGLGLALVKGLTALHGGTVEADSAGTGHGTEFRIRLPLAPPPA